MQVYVASSESFLSLLPQPILTPMVVLALRITQSVELALIGISVITAITVLRIFYKTPLLHRNLLGLLGMIAGEYSIVMSSRVIMLVLSFNNEEYLENASLVVTTGAYAPIEWIRVFGCGCIMFDIICITVERALATFYLETYEKNSSNRFLIFCFLFQTLLAALFTILFFKDILSYVEVISIGILLCCFIFTTFIYTHRINLKRYKSSAITLQNRRPRKYTLSERFQLSENIRTFKILKRVIIFIIVTNVFIIIGVITVILLHRDLSMLIFRAVFNIVVIIYSICVPVIFVSSVEIWRIKYFRLFTNARDRLLCRRRRVEDSSSATLLRHLRSTNGQQLAFDNAKEKDITFALLEKSWK